MNYELKNVAARGFLWGGLSNGLIQILGAVFGVVLLNLLEPEDYGKIAVLLIYSNIAANLQESGFIAALANKKNPTHEDYNAVFWFNIIVSLSLYGILYLCSPLIAEFNGDPELTPLARYLFLGFVFSAFGTVQRAYLFGHLMVKQQSLISIVALIISNCIGIGMAFAGYAYWGLATQSLSYVIIVMLLDWYVSPWRPSLKINLRPAWQMFGFSSKLLITNLFAQLNSQVFSVLLGHFYSSSAVVGHYSNARKWNDMASSTVNGMVTSVAQPVLAQVREEEGRYRNVFRKMLRFISFISFPCMLGLGLISREFILILVGEKWAESIPLLAMLTVYGAFVPITTLYSNMAISQGRSGTNLFCTVTLCVLIWLGLLIILPYGIDKMVIFFVTVNILWLFVWQWFAWRLFHLRLIDALKDVLPFLFLALTVMVTTWFITRPIENLYLSLIAKIIIAATLYTGLTYLSGAKILRESIEYLRKKGKK